MCEAGRLCPRRQSQSLTTAFSFVVADLGGGTGVLLISWGSLAAELGRVADRNAELSLAQRASGVMGAALNCDWLCGQPFFSSFSGTSCVLAGWKELLESPSKWQMKGHQQIPWLGGVEGVVRGHESSLHGSHTGVG